MDVVGDLGPVQLPDMNAEVSLQDLHRHGCLLLSDASERLETPRAHWIAEFMQRKLRCGGRHGESGNLPVEYDHLYRQS